MDVEVLGHLPTIFALITTGILAGLLVGLLGVGGGIVIVPVFFLFQSFDVSIQSAMMITTANSLVYVCLHSYLFSTTRWK